MTCLYFTWNENIIISVPPYRYLLVLILNVYRYRTVCTGTLLKGVIFYFLIYNYFIRLYHKQCDLDQGAKKINKKNALKSNKSFTVVLANLEKQQIASYF